MKKKKEKNKSKQNKKQLMCWRSLNSWKIKLTEIINLEASSIDGQTKFEFEASVIVRQTLSLLFSLYLQGQS